MKLHSSGRITESQTLPPRSASWQVWALWLRAFAWGVTLLLLMATTKKRINLSVSRDIQTALARLAARDEVPQATKALHLLRLALQWEEDAVLDAIASRRDVQGARFVSHGAAWR